MPTVAETLSAALHNHQAGNLSQAEQLYQSILQAQPDHAETHHLLGVLDFQTGRFDAAVARIRHALTLNPAAAVYHCNLGLVHQALDQFDEAVASFQQALRILPHFPEAHNNVGVLLFQHGSVDEAVPHYQEAIRLQPAYAEAHNNLGNALQQQGKPQEAIIRHREALRLNPRYGEAFNNLGVALQRLGKLEEAVTECKKALSIQPDYPQAVNNLGMALRLQGHWDEAEALFQRAIRLKADYAEPHFNLALVRLVHGDFERGWPEYEWRATPFKLGRSFSQPLWNGSHLNGQTILLFAEQGLGDTLQFIRYVALARERGGNVIVECQPALVRLLAGVPGIGRLLAQGSPLPPFDVQAPLPSLPGIVHTALDTIPGDVPYLKADAHLVGHWRQEITKSGVPCPMSDVKPLSDDTALRTSDTRHAFRIGIAWQGNPGFLHDSLRSIPLAHFARLADVPGVQLISLQKGPGTEQIMSDVRCLKSDVGNRPFDIGHRTTDIARLLLDFGSRLDEESGAFLDTAAVMKNLDLVISSDTVVPHLTGALGVPVWVALAFAPDWRWLLEREDSPWYPTMRLFRQRRQGDWEEVFERIAAELTAMVKGANR